MSHSVVTTDIRGQLIFLGTGTSTGVPMIGCGCGVCTSGNTKNKRTRCGLAVGLPEGNLLIDTTPDLRQQLLRERIGVAHAVAFTHDHADHIFGLDDIRVFFFYLGHSIPVFCEDFVEQRLRTSFDYAFTPEAAGYAGGVPQINFRRIEAGVPFEALGAWITPLRLHHGRFRVLGFRIGNVAYCTDTNRIPPESMELLRGLDVLIVDALRARPHVSHYSVQQAIEVAQQVGAKRTLFTHMGHELDHDATNAMLPAGMELAYDGMRLELT